MKRLLILLLLLPFAASAQAGKFDGAWTGKAGDWKIRLDVKGKRGQLALTCTTVTHRFEIPITDEGIIESWLSSETFARRQIAGKLPSVFLTTSGYSCPGGPTNLTR